MTTFLAFVRKEALHILRDRRTLLVVVLLPIVQIILFSFAISTEVNDLRVRVATTGRLTDVGRLAARLDASHYLRVEPLNTPAGSNGKPADRNDRTADRGNGTADRKSVQGIGLNATDEAIDHALRRGEADAVLVADGRQGRMQLIVDASNPNTATMAAGYVAGALTGSTPDVRMLYNPQMLSAHNFVPGLMGLIFVIICSVLTSVAIVREKETGSIELLLVSPVSPMITIAAKITPYFAVSCINLATILLLARFLLGIPLAGHVAATVTLSLVYIVFALSIGLLISTLVRTQVAAMIVALVSMMLPTILLSGMIFPVENAPLPLQWLSAVVPARWYIGAVRKVMIEGLPLTRVWPELAVLTGMTVATLIVALKKYNKRID